jgi:hypothetical protein
MPWRWTIGAIWMGSTMEIDALELAFTVGVFIFGIYIIYDGWRK